MNLRAGWDSPSPRALTRHRALATSVFDGPAPTHPSTLGIPASPSNLTGTERAFQGASLPERPGSRSSSRPLRRGLPGRVRVSAAVRALLVPRCALAPARVMVSRPTQSSPLVGRALESRHRATRRRCGVQPQPLPARRPQGSARRPRRPRTPVRGAEATREVPLMGRMLPAGASEAANVALENNPAAPAQAVSPSSIAGPDGPTGKDRAPLDASRSRAAQDIAATPT